MIHLEYRRTKENKGLELWVNETGVWVNYKKSKHYVVEYNKYSSNSGFHTAQVYLKLGAKFIQITEENYRVPEDE